MKSRFQPKLPAGPLERFARSLDRDSQGHERCVNRVELRKGTSLHRAFRRALQEGELTVWQADKLACALGYHPGDLWPEWWDDDQTDGLSGVA